MVILFLASGLEPGKDGVGDYTRLLAAECIRRGQRCQLMSLNDSFVSQPIESSESVDGIGMPVLRLPASLSREERIRLATEFQARQPADWISLQFVCYGFNSKGVVWNLAGFLEPIIGGLPLHVMFHETWIGIDEGASLKSRMVGGIQRHFIQRLLRRLRPRLVTTSTSFYVSLLRDIGFTAIETPLSSNLPVVPRGDRFDLPDRLIRAGICDPDGTHADRWMGLFFGALYPSWKAEPFLGIMASAVEKSGRRVCLVSAGRLGGPGKVRWEKMRETYGHAIDFIALGECTSAQISALMQIADFGISNTAWYLLGKSSSTATMLDHGLPVIVTDYGSRQTAAVSQSENPLIHLCDETLEAKLWKGLPRQPARYGGGEAAEKLIGCLTKLSDAKR